MDVIIKNCCMATVYVSLRRFIQCQVFVPKTKYLIGLIHLPNAFIGMYAKAKKLWTIMNEVANKMIDIFKFKKLFRLTKWEFFLKKKKGAQ